MIYRQFNKCSYFKLRLVTAKAKADERKSVSALKNPYRSIPTEDFNVMYRVKYIRYTKIS